MSNSQECVGDVKLHLTRDGEDEKEDKMDGKEAGPHAPGATSAGQPEQRTGTGRPRRKNTPGRRTDRRIGERDATKGGTVQHELTHTAKT